MPDHTGDPKMTDFRILQVYRCLLISPLMTQEQAKAHILSHPDFEYRQAAGL